MELWTWTIAGVLLMWTLAVDAFNIDVRTARTHRGDPGSMFGFTVVQHQQDNDHLLLVGAPKAQTRQRNRNSVKNGGAVYRCWTNSNAACSEIPVDIQDVGTGWNGTAYTNKEQKSGQWLGASLYSSGRDGVVVACAPRYVYFSSSLNKREPTGNCFHGNLRTNTFQDYSPCKTGGESYHLQGFCQAGMSTAVSQDGKYIALGAVGSWYWQGQLIVQDLQNDQYYFETYESPKIYDDTYMGYSMATGDFNGDQVEDFAVGHPKMNHTGRVSLFTRQVEVITNVSGTQMGEYYGYSVTVDDFNNDGKDDVAVGAPLYTDRTADAYENGRVYIHYQSPTSVFSNLEPTILNGNKKYGSRFGLAVSKIGDVNMDDYNDLAVGAPYDGDDKKGAIYIFHGGPDGIRPEVSQIIYAADVNTGLSAFGFSLTGGDDIDANQYPDMSVGAYSSDSAVIFRTRPIVKVSAKVTVTPSEIDLRDRGCQTVDGFKHPCMTVKTCISYTGVGTPRNIEFKLNWTLDDISGFRSKRAFYLAGNDQGRTKTDRRYLTKNREVCTDHSAYVLSSLRDKLNPISIDLTFSKLDPENPAPDELIPILDQYIPRDVRTLVNIKKNCGSDKVCIPDLLTYGRTLVDHHVMGTENKLAIAVQVENHGEDAFEAQALITLPPGVEYFDMKTVRARRTIQCTPPSPGDDPPQVICELGNPMRGNEVINFELVVSPVAINASASTIDFVILVNSTNKENKTDLINNYDLVKIPISVIPAVQLTGVSKPEQVFYNFTKSTLITAEEDIGPQVIHLYEVRSLGPSDISELDLQIRWPVSLKNGKHLLYVVEQPKLLKGYGKCTFNYVNPENLTVTPPNSADVVIKESSRIRRESENNAKPVTCHNGESLCQLIKCTIWNMGQEDHNNQVLLEVRSRLWTNSLIDADYDTVSIVSEGIIQVMATPYHVKPKDYPVDSTQVETPAVAGKPYTYKKPLPFWVIAVAIAGGCILLLLLIALLYFCGFFKRDRPTEKGTLMKPEKNGHQYGDKYQNYESVGTAEDYPY